MSFPTNFVWMSKMIILRDNTLSLSTNKSHHNLYSRCTISKYYMPGEAQIKLKTRLGVKCNATQHSIAGEGGVQPPQFHGGHHCCLLYFISFIDYSKEIFASRHSKLIRSKAMNASVTHRLIITHFLVLTSVGLVSSILMPFGYL